VAIKKVLVARNCGNVLVCIRHLLCAFRDVMFFERTVVLLKKWEFSELCCMLYAERDEASE
jgi:hypothetical protein